MTVGSQVKSCFSTVKSIDAGISILASKTQNEEAKQAFSEAQTLIKEMKDDLQKQVIFLSKEEPQY